jgi:copper transport protein
LALVVWRRSRRHEPTRGAELIVRFSHVATVSLIAVVVAGVLMAITVLDSVGELTSTEWGQILLLKTAAVALAGCFGAYNHFRLEPALEATPDDPALALRLRSILTAEAIVLTFVVIVTAWLVAAAS